MLLILGLSTSGFTRTLSPPNLRSFEKNNGREGFTISA
jgi:hypothetical protein